MMAMTADDNIFMIDHILPLFFPADSALFAAFFCISLAAFWAVSNAWRSQFFSTCIKSRWWDRSLISPKIWTWDEDEREYWVGMNQGKDNEMALTWPEIGNELNIRMDKCHDEKNTK